MQQIFGDFLEQDEDQEHLVIHFSPTSVPLPQRWRNSGLSADFVAEYWSTFLEIGDIFSCDRQQEIKGAINYIANELLENGMKFTCQPENHAVRLGLYFYQHEFRFYASNAIDSQEIKKFQEYLRKLSTQDPLDLYIRQIERNAAGESTGSHLGLLSIINDYQARMAWKFETGIQTPSVTVVTTMVQLPL